MSFDYGMLLNCFLYHHNDIYKNRRKMIIYPIILKIFIYNYEFERIKSNPNRGPHEYEQRRSLKIGNLEFE